MLTNPSQDYWHLKQCRAVIESQRFEGIRAPSSRSQSAGKILALFSDQSKNVAMIEPVDIEMRLIQPTGGPFQSHHGDLLAFEACEVRATSNPLPHWASSIGSWKSISFNA
jgi:hypothetical protein